MASSSNPCMQRRWCAHDLVDGYFVSREDVSGPGNAVTLRDVRGRVSTLLPHPSRESVRESLLSSGASSPSICSLSLCFLFERSRIARTYHGGRPLPFQDQYSLRSYSRGSMRPPETKTRSPMRPFRTVYTNTPLQAWSVSKYVVAL
jgi:hypothetical protein